MSTAVGRKRVKACRAVSSPLHHKNNHKEDKKHVPVRKSSIYFIGLLTSCSNLFWKFLIVNNVSADKNAWKSSNFLGTSTSTFSILRLLWSYLRKLHGSWDWVSFLLFPHSSYYIAGLQPVIYLLINTKIRGYCLSLLGAKRTDNEPTTTVNSHYNLSKAHINDGITVI